jgi:hypothetical protein
MLPRHYVCARSNRSAVSGMAWFVGGVQVLLLASAAQAGQQQDHKRYVTEEDAIRMVRIAGGGAINSYAGTLTENFTYFSPDRKQFVIVLKNGNLERNTNLKCSLACLPIRTMKALKSLSGSRTMTPSYFLGRIPMKPRSSFR